MGGKKLWGTPEGDEGKKKEPSKTHKTGWAEAVQEAETREKRAEGKAEKGGKKNDLELKRIVAGSYRDNDTEKGGDTTKGKTTIRNISRAARGAVHTKQCVGRGERQKAKPQQA